MNDLILQPILFMGLLSLVMMLLMYITRIPAAKVLEAEGGRFTEALPSRHSWAVCSRVNGASGLPTTTITFGNSRPSSTRWCLVIWALGHTDPLTSLCCVVLLRAAVCALVGADHDQSCLGALQSFLYELDRTRCYADQRDHHRLWRRCRGYF